MIYIFILFVCFVVDVDVVAIHLFHQFSLKNHEVQQQCNGSENYLNFLVDFTEPFSGDDNIEQVFQKKNNLKELQKLVVLSSLWWFTLIIKHGDSDFVMLSYNFSFLAIVISIDDRTIGMFSVF